MMLKITTRASEPGVESLQLEGRLAGEYVAELRTAARDALGRSGRLALDLSGLTFVDAEGVRLLRRLRDDDVRVFGCSSFIAQLLELR